MTVTMREVRKAFADAFMRHPTGRMNDVEVMAVLADLDRNVALVVRRWYMQPGYENRRSVPKVWHCFEVARDDERRNDYPARPTLCGKSLPFAWKGSLYDSQPTLEAIGGLYVRDRWKKVCTKCRTRAAA